MLTPDAPSPRRAPRGCPVHRFEGPSSAESRSTAASKRCTPHARAGRCHGPAIRVGPLTPDAPSLRGASRGYSRTAASVTCRHQRVAVRPPPSLSDPPAAATSAAAGRREPVWRWDPARSRYQGCQGRHARRRGCRRLTDRVECLTPGVVFPRRASRGCTLSQCWDRSSFPLRRVCPQHCERRHPAGGESRMRLGEQIHEQLNEGTRCQAPGRPCRRGQPTPATARLAPTCGTDTHEALSSTAPSLVRCRRRSIRRSRGRQAAPGRAPRTTPGA